MKGLSYVLKPDEISFFYNDILVINNSRRNPFICAKVGVDDTEKTIALYKYKIKKTTPESCYIDFYCDDRKVECKILASGPKLSFSLINGEDLKEVCLTLSKSPEDLVFGLSASRTENHKNVILYNNRDKIYKNARNSERYYVEYVNRLTRRNKRLIKRTKLDQKLAFYLKNKYFFENKSILSYDLEINDNISIKTTQKDIKFDLIFSNNVHVASNGENKNTESIKKYYGNDVFLKLNSYSADKIRKFEKKTKLKVRGIIIKEHTFNYAVTKVFVTDMHKKGLDVIFSFKATIEETGRNSNRKLHEIKREENGEKKVFFESEEGSRKYINEIRYYLDAGADGIYLEEGFDENTVNIIHHKMTLMAKEYPRFTLFHDRISELNDDFGYYIIKRKKLIKHFGKFASDYVNSGENRVGKECKRYRKRRKYAKPDFCVNIYSMREKKIKNLINNLNSKL